MRVLVDNVWVLLGLIVIFAQVLPAIICGRMAARMGRSRGLWIFLGALLSWSIVIILAIAGDEEKRKR